MEGMNRAPGAGEFLEFISDLSSRFVNLEPAQVDAEVSLALKRIGDFFRANRCVLYRVDADQASVCVANLAEMEIRNPLPSSLNVAEQCPWLFEQIVINRTVLRLGSLDELPAAASVDRESLQRWETVSALFIPLFAANAIEYVLAIGTGFGNQVHWPDAFIPRLRLLGETLVGALKRKSLEEDRHEALRFERLIADISLRLAGAWSDHVDEQIELALREVLVFTRNDQCGLLTIYPENGQAYLTYLGHVDGVVPANPTLTPPSNTPCHRARGARHPAGGWKQPCIYVGVGLSRA